MSLTLAIAALKAGMADYNANAPDDDAAAVAYAAVSYEPPLDALRAFNGPAEDHAAALLALDAALEEIADSDIETATVLVRAAALFLREVCVG
jgi:hypothetical protein